MAAPIEFYFDFSSPFGYLASEKIDQLAAKYGREVVWRPFLLGAVFKITGGMPTMPTRSLFALAAVMIPYMDASRSASVLTFALAEQGCCCLISGLQCKTFALRP